MLLGAVGVCRAGAVAAASVHDFGPYDVGALAGGIGLTRPLPRDAAVLRAGASWSITAWVRPVVEAPGVVILGGMGKARGGVCDCLVLRDGRLGLWLSGGARLQSMARVPAGGWHAVVAIYGHGVARLYLDGRLVGAIHAVSGPVGAQMRLAPVVAGKHFGGFLAHWRVQPRALTQRGVDKFVHRQPAFDLIQFHDLGVGWPLQTRQQVGLTHPQPVWMLPRSRAPGGRWRQPPPARSRRTYPHAEPVRVQAPLRTKPDDSWVVNDWRLQAAPKVRAPGALISESSYDDATWYPAVVPGTVLTTLVARGVYPDPYYGLNDLLIPQRLAHQAYWYRTAFVAPRGWAGRELTLRFGGVNYMSRVWLNGRPVGRIRGAFAQGIFNVTGRIRPGQLNVLAVRVAPPPHPGIAFQKSIAAGPGPNGGALDLDGPTFIATIGWDWMPVVPDRDIGIWQPVMIHASGKLLLHAPHVITRLPLPRRRPADVTIAVSIANRHSRTVPATLVARFGGITVRKRLRLAPGTTRVRLTPAAFPALRLRHPHLWWPNGYGAPYLYKLSLAVYDRSAGTAGRLSDRRTLHFGIRQITYGLSLFGRNGRLRRVVVNPTAGREEGIRALVDVRHRAIKRTPNGWAYSLTAAGEHSAAVRPSNDTALSPYLVIRVNGVRIAARGGDWGMDDAMKRISSARLRPYFRLTRRANLDIIRNWIGSSTEPAFYRLADRYGLLVLNDFWDSTQDYNAQAENPRLFLANARNVIERYRNHPSIAVWFGRNEGVPQPIINNGLAHLINTLDGTRLYMPSSNQINLQGSGPYDYQAPVNYFTTLARGFSVEVGTDSLASLRTLKAMMPKADLWPISDTWAYHDWNFGGNGNVRIFMHAMDRQLGTPKTLVGFERRAQLMDYVDYRAIFEGFNAHLWTRNSGRLLWMTQPAWPSNIWQIYTSDYATAGAYYGVKEACQPLHVQMNLPNYSLAVVNTTRLPHGGLQVRSRILSLRGRVLATRRFAVTAPADAVARLPRLDLARYLHSHRLVFIQLQLRGHSGRMLSENVYWQGRNSASLRALNTLVPQDVTLSATPGGRNASGQDRVISVRLVNRGHEPSVAVIVTALDRHGHRVLPSYYSGNYLTLMPGETRRINVLCPVHGVRCARLQLHGWNVVPKIIAIPTGRGTGHVS